jgi:uncharacterized protein involved in response to NO
MPTTKFAAILPKSLFAYGFRPFFLLGALWVPIALATLFAGIAWGLWPVSAPPLFLWHGHELLFGFVVSAIAGFLLTAVPTWTSTPPVSGWPLIGLAALWVSGRVVMYPALQLDSTYAAFIELAFVPALMVALAVPLMRTRNLRNYPFLVMLALLFALNFVFHGRALGWLGALPFDPLRICADVVMLMIVVVGGRIVPLFTRNALAGSGRPSSILPAPRLEAVALAAVIGVAVSDLAVPNTRVAGALAALAAAVLAANLARWDGRRAVRMPLVFVLHVGYGWVVVALALKAAFLLGQAAWAANWLHALTAGAFGTMILAVTTRVALGHTGRPLVVRRPIVLAYALVGLGAAVRVWGPWALPFEYTNVIASSMVLWSAAYLLFLAVYLPILIGPRADAGGGKP